MAEDVLALLDYLDWTEERSLHLIGMSLGGMIAQGMLKALKFLLPTLTSYVELAYRAPERFISLALGVTTAGGFPLCNFPPVGSVQTFLKERRLSQNGSSGLDSRPCQGTARP
jgi:hypothetical protein